jgi:hypothetical protein
MIYREELKNLGWSNELIDAVEEIERALPRVAEPDSEVYEPSDLMTGWAPPPCTMVDLASTTPPALEGLTLGRPGRRSGQTI